MTLRCAMSSTLCITLCITLDMSLVDCPTLLERLERLKGASGLKGASDHSCTWNLSAKAVVVAIDEPLIEADVGREFMTLEEVDETDCANIPA